MNKPDPVQLSSLGQGLLNRRSFMRGTAGALGGFSLAHLLAQDKLLANSVVPIRPKINPDAPYAPRAPHHAARAKKVLIIFCTGAVSHVDTFDYKPDLVKLHGQKPKGMPTVTFEGPPGSIAKPFWDFKPRGQSGKMVSSLIPNLARQADDFCFFHALHTETSAHPTGENFFATGSTLEGFPSFGAWVTYALGSDNEDLPGFVAINDPRGKPRSGKNNWGNGFLPAAFQGTDFNAAHPPANLSRPTGVSAKTDQRIGSFLEKMNARHLDRFPGDNDLAARIASYELAGRMQMSIPEITDISGEPDWMLREYGADDTRNETKREYARNCILARRLLEKGVRCVQLFNGSDASGGNGITNWDSHKDITKTHSMQAEIMDQPTAALIRDLRARGLLDDTLVVWCTEFGRMPFLQGNGTGRDHNPGAFTCFMTGAGVKPGFSYGESDAWGYKAAVDSTTIYDFNATILHILGLDHERLTFYSNGLERRLTSVHGNVVKEVLV